MRLTSYKSLRYILIGLVGLIIVLVALPAVFLNKDDIRQKLAQTAYEKTGRNLELGDIGFSVFPTPRFTAENVKLANWRDGSSKSSQPWMLTVKKVTVIAAPMDLLTGKVTARTVQLDSPRVLLEQRGGHKNWRFLPPGTLPPRAMLGRPVLSQNPSANTIDLAQALGHSPAMANIVSGIGIKVAFEHMRIRNGSVRYSSKAEAKPIDVENVQLDIDAKTMAGPFQTSGTLDYVGQTVSISGVVDEVSRNRAIPLDVTVSMPSSSLHVDGLLLRDTGSGVVLKANVDAKSADLGKLLNHFEQSVPSKLNGLAASLSGDLRAGAIKGELKSGSLQIGPDTIATDLSWNSGDDHPAFSINLKAQRIQLDSWLEAKTAFLSVDEVMPQFITPAYAADAKGKAKGDVLFPALQIPKLPRNVDVALMANADVVVWRGQAVHNVIVDATLSRGDVVVNKLAADMPGASNISVFGFVGTAQENSNLDLTVQMKAANLRGMLNWLGTDVSRVPADRLRRAELSSVLRLNETGLLQLRDMDLTLDSSHGKGAADIRLTPRLAVGLSLAVDQINFDAYRLKKSQQRADAYRVIYASNTQTRPSIAPPHSVVPDLSALQALDANVNLNIGRLIVSKQVLDRVNLKGALNNGDINVSQLTASLGHVGKISAAGLLQILGKQVPQLQGVKLSIQSQRADRLVKILPFSVPGFVKTWHKVNATVNASGPLTNLSTNALIIADATRIHGAGTLDALRGMPTADTRLNVTAPTLGGFAKTFGGKVAPSLAKLKNVRLSVPVLFQDNAVSLPALTFSARGNAENNKQDIKVHGTVIIKTTGPRPYVVANLNGNTLPIFASRMSATRVSQIIPASTLQTTMSNPVPAAFLPVSANSGGEAWQSLRDFDGQLNAKFDQVVTPQLHIQDVTVAAVLNQGILDITKAEGALLKGTAALNGQVDVRQIPSIRANLQAKKLTLTKNSSVFSGKVAPVTGIVSFTADLRSQGKTQDALVKGLSGKGTLHVTEGSIAGADLDAVNSKLANLKSFNDVLDAIDAGQKGRTLFDSLKGTFSVDKGIVHSKDLALEAPSGKGGVSGFANLFSRTLNLKANYALASLKDAPALGVNLDGAWEKPRVVFDIKEFQGYVLQRGFGQFLKVLKKKSQKSSSQNSSSQSDTTTDANTTTSDSSSQSQSTEDQSTKSKKKIKVEDVLRGILQAIPQN